MHHQRAFNSQPLQTAMVDFILRTRGLEHLGQIIAVLRSAGYESTLPDRAALPRLPRT